VFLIHVIFDRFLFFVVITKQTELHGTQNEVFSSFHSSSLLHMMTSCDYITHKQPTHFLESRERKKSTLPTSQKKSGHNDNTYLKLTSYGSIHNVNSC
jgi:hypothetical protein